MSKFVDAFRQKAMYQKIGLIVLIILVLTVILLCVLNFTRIFSDMYSISQFLLALALLDNAIISWKENKLLAIISLVLVVVFIAGGIFFLVI